MNEIQTIQSLSELLRILCRSLPAYLDCAKPWTKSGDRRLPAAIEHLVADQRRYAVRVAEAIVEQGARPDTGRFASIFTAKNDLSLDYLLEEILDQQDQDIAVIEQCAAELEGIPSLHVLAEEILGNARGHLDILRELAGVSG